MRRAVMMPGMRSGELLVPNLRLSAGVRSGRGDNVRLVVPTAEVRSIVGVSVSQRMVTN